MVPTSDSRKARSGEMSEDSREIDEPHAIGPRRRILVVDDNRDAAESLAMLLRLIGHDVRTVHDALKVLATAEIYRPELIVLDIGLPGMDGYEVARRLRKQPWSSQTKLVALTGYAGVEIQHRLNWRASITTWSSRLRLTHSINSSRDSSSRRTDLSARASLTKKRTRETHGGLLPGCMASLG